MAFRCLPLTIIISGLAASFPSFALEVLDDEHLSGVTGQAAGIKITQEYENRIDSLDYWDDNGWGAEGTQGRFTVHEVVIRTDTNRPDVREVRLRKDDNNQTYLEITDIDYSLEQSYKLSINGQSLGTYGSDNYQGTNGRKIILRPGGAKDENGADIGGPGGINIEWIFPAAVSYDSWMEKNGVRQTQTTIYDDVYSKGNGGLNNTNISVDIVDEGLRIGLPEVVDGFKGEMNRRIGDDVFGSVAMRNINYKPGGYVMVKSAKETGDIGLELDLQMAAGSNFEMLDISGRVQLDAALSQGDSYLTTNNHVHSSKITLNDALTVKGMRLNIDGERGAVFDFDTSPGAPTTVAQANLTISEQKIMQGGGDMVAKSAAAISMGAVNMQINLTNQSYIQVQGY